MAADTSLPGESDRTAFKRADNQRRNPQKQDSLLGVHANDRLRGHATALTLLANTGGLGRCKVQEDSGQTDAWPKDAGRNPSPGGGDRLIVSQEASTKAEGVDPEKKTQPEVLVGSGD